MKIQFCHRAHSFQDVILEICNLDHLKTICQQDYFYYLNAYSNDILDGQMTTKIPHQVYGLKWTIKQLWGIQQLKNYFRIVNSTYLELFETLGETNSPSVYFHIKPMNEHLDTRFVNQVIIFKGEDD